MGQRASASHASAPGVSLDEPIRDRSTANGRPSLQLLERAFTILNLFTPEHPEWTTTEAAHATGVPVPTAYRILAALRARSFVAQDDVTKRFRLGVGALELGERARALVDVRALALPVLRRLCRESGETALLTATSEHHDQGVCLERVESPHPLRLSVQTGRLLPLHAGASQKVLLAYLPDEEIQRILAGPLERVCRATIVDPDELRADLARIRRRGWAESFEETDVGVWGIATPILDADGRLVAAVGLAGPGARISRSRLREHLAKLRSGAEDIGRAIGGRRPSTPPPTDASAKE
jgi:IclR family transcriptional regulator, acetate operon repressor